MMLNAILQLKSKGGGSEAAMEAVLMVRYTSDGISNQEQTRWLTCSSDGGLRGFELARNLGFSKITELVLASFLSRTGQV